LDKDRGDVSGGQVGMALAGLVSCSLWTFYGARQHDRWIVLPNVVGILLSCLQLYIVWLVKRDGRVSITGSNDNIKS
jgi:hypothetical protein